MTHWVDEWVSLVADILTLAPAAKGRLLLDLVNEPDGYQLQWEVGMRAALLSHAVVYWLVHRSST
jgi:hypothetical protein